MLQGLERSVKLLLQASLISLGRHVTGDYDGWEERKEAEVHLGPQSLYDPASLHLGTKACYNFFFISHASLELSLFPLRMLIESPSPPYVLDQS